MHAICLLFVTDVFEGLPEGEGRVRADIPRRSRAKPGPRLRLHVQHVGMTKLQLHGEETVSRCFTSNAHLTDLELSHVCTIGAQTGKAECKTINYLV